MPEIPRDDSMSDPLSGIVRESGDFGTNSTIPHHVHSTGEKEPRILAFIGRGKQMGQADSDDLFPARV